MIKVFVNSIDGFNIIPTIFISLVIIYWLSIIVGFFDIDLFDIDLDMDVDGDIEIESTEIGMFHSFLAFLNVSELPFMLVISFIALFFWIFAMLIYLLPFEIEGALQGILLLPNFLISTIFAKFATSPLKPLFREMYKEDNEKVEGICIILSNLSEGRLGQAEIKRNGAPFVINVKVYEEDFLKKGDEAIVLKKDNEKNYYYVKKFEGVD
jgi:hypothetical protein